jgi:hypothetical protein
LDPVLDTVAEIDEPIVDSAFDLLDLMPVSTVDPNLEPIRFRIEDSTSEPLNNETSADPSLEPVLKPALELTNY